GVAHYLLNFVPEDAAKGPALLEQAARFLRVRMWGVDADEPHRDALASATSSSSIWAHPSGSSSAAQSLPPRSVPMNTVLSEIDPPRSAKADFQTGVVRITANEYETARAVAAGRAR